MPVENIQYDTEPNLHPEEESQRIAHMRAEITKLRDQAVELDKKDAVRRHLAELSDEDIAEIPEDQLELWYELQRAEITNWDDYETLRSKIENLMSADMPTAEEIRQDNKKAFQSISHGIRSLLVNTLLKKFQESSLVKKSDREAA